jgi:SAM-dependent methyltransferase
MTHAFGAASEPSPDLLRRPKSLARHVYDFVGAPVRMAILPDELSERIGLTSLRAERMAAVLPELKGRVLDVGAGDNLLVRLYRQYADTRAGAAADADLSVGVDTHDWGGGCTIVSSSRSLPFEDSSFDTVCFVACLNHIPERADALAEARRLLRPGGRVVATMIGKVVGAVGHTIWWYGEDRHREMHPEERWGLKREEMVRLFESAGLRGVKTRGFAYGLNTLYVATR